MDNLNSSIAIETIGLKIKKIREWKGYSQDAVAHQLGITQKAYSRIEAGGTKLSLQRAKDIAAILEIDLIDLLGSNEKFFISEISKNQSVNLGNGSVMNNISLTDKEREQYEKRIQHLEGEVLFLRNLLNK